jgi:hypothetical protein
MDWSTGGSLSLLRLDFTDEEKLTVPKSFRSKSNSKRAKMQSSPWKPGWAAK